MGIIRLNNIRSYAYHGCLEEEALIGGNYSVEIELEADLSTSEQSDNLNDTIDYCKVYEIVQKEMSIRSKLIEHVAQRIATNLKNTFPILVDLSVTVTKIAPPMNGDVESVSVTVS